MRADVQDIGARANEDREQCVNNPLPTTGYLQDPLRAKGTKNQQDTKPALAC